MNGGKGLGVDIFDWLTELWRNCLMHDQLLMILKYLRNKYFDLLEQTFFENNISISSSFVAVRGQKHP